MTLENCDTDEDDSAELEELLAALEEDGSTSRYDNPHSSNSSHAETHSDTSILHTQEERGPPFSIITHDEVEEKATDAHLSAAREEKASDTHSSHLHAAHNLHADPSNNTVDYTPPIAPPKASHAHHCEMRAFAVERPPSPPPPPFCGCSCFLLPSHKRVKKQKKYSEAPEQRSSDRKAGIPQAMARDKDDNDDWLSAQKKSGPQEMDDGGLFDVKSTEKEFKRASMKEKQLTQEAQKFLKTVAST